MTYFITTLFALGMVCVIGAIVGGGLKALGVELPLIESMNSRLLLGAFGVVMLGSAWLMNRATAPKPAPPPAKPIADLCNNFVGGTNFNSVDVSDGPKSISTPCEIVAAAHISEVVTYHWNNRQGARPGTIQLVNEKTGARFGPFPAAASSGQYDAPNVNWSAPVDVDVPPGVYKVFDSDVGTWSWNAPSGGYGFVKVHGYYTGP